VFQAEATAIYQALCWHTQFHSHSSFIIFSDSFSVIQSLINPKQHIKLLQDIVLLIANFTGYFGGICWVKAHVGIEGNEKADELAKLAASNDFQGPKIDVRMPKSYLKGLVKAFILNKWQLYWNISSNGRHTFRFINKVSNTVIYDNIYINMFLTNRGPFPEFLYRINKLNSPNCVCSGIGNAYHYTFECPLTESYHFHIPNVSCEPIWFNNILHCKSNYNKLCKLMKWLKANEFFLYSTT